MQFTQNNVTQNLMWLDLAHKGMSKFATPLSFESFKKMVMQQAKMEGVCVRVTLGAQTHQGTTGVVRLRRTK
jgi:hypothetical protein